MAQRRAPRRRRARRCWVAQPPTPPPCAHAAALRRRRRRASSDASAPSAVPRPPRACRWRAARLPLLLEALGGRLQWHGPCCARRAASGGARPRLPLGQSGCRQAGGCGRGGARHRPQGINLLQVAHAHTQADMPTCVTAPTSLAPRRPAAACSARLCTSSASGSSPMSTWAAAAALGGRVRTSCSRWCVAGARSARVGCRGPS